MVCGQRQVGKSTMLNHIREENRRYVTMDDNNTRQNVSESLAGRVAVFDMSSLSRSEIVKSYYNAGKPADLYYYRDIDKKEIDLLIIEGNRLYPVEIKRSKEPADPDKNFKVLSHLGLEVMPGICICMSDEIIPYNRDVWYVPVTVL